MTGAPASTLERRVAATSPYPWPYDGRLNPSRLGLLVLTTESAGADDPHGEVLGAVGGLQAAVAMAGGHVVSVATSSGGRPATAAAVTSTGHDGFFESGLDTMLRRVGIDQLLLCGQWLEIGVHSTMRSANDRGYECLLVADASRSAAPGIVRQSLSMIEMSGGIFGAVGSLAPVVEALALTQT